jgi:hypothetical protein
MDQNSEKQGTLINIQTSSATWTQIQTIFHEIKAT